ncbi:unnamed protein product, partial [marine sediment metagenome]
MAMLIPTRSPLKLPGPLATMMASIEFGFACGEDNPIGLKLKPVYDGEKVRAEFTPGEYHQGWDNVT